jgi:hypothetical protein
MKKSHQFTLFSGSEPKYRTFYNLQNEIFYGLPDRLFIT